MNHRQMGLVAAWSVILFLVAVLLLALLAAPAAGAEACQVTEQCTHPGRI